MTGASRITRWLIAAGIITLYGVLVWIIYRRRAATSASPPSFNKDAPLVVWASQNGYARELAEHTAQMLTDAGKPTQAFGLDQLSHPLLRQARQILFIASTTGQGDPPDHAVAFVQKNKAATLDLHHLQYAVLALGNREYGNFCAFGHELDDWLRRRHAQRAFDLIEVDDIDEDAIRRWQYNVSRFTEIPPQPDWSSVTYGRWRLTERRELNPQSTGNPVFHIALLPSNGQLPNWNAGDIAEISPRQSPEAIQRFLDLNGWEGQTRVETRDGDALQLAELLARSVLPACKQEGDIDNVVGTLRPLPHREYSIASIPEEGALWLLVRRMAYPDGTLGLGSGWLCQFAAEGSEIALRIRNNPNFHPPEANVPMILIGNGTGIASLRALLRARIAAGARRNWLLYGERNSNVDFFYRDEIRDWQEKGWLERLDLAFSRDATEKRYVQDCVREAHTSLASWVGEGAYIYVCGSLSGMAPGVDFELEKILGAQQKIEMLTNGRYRRDVY